MRIFLNSFFQLRFIKPEDPKIGFFHILIRLNKGTCLDLRTVTVDNTAVLRGTPGILTGIVHRTAAPFDIGKAEIIGVWCPKVHAALCHANKAAASFSSCEKKRIVSSATRPAAR